MNWFSIDFKSPDLKKKTEFTYGMFSFNASINCCWDDLCVLSARWTAVAWRTAPSTASGWECVRRLWRLARSTTWRCKCMKQRMKVIIRSHTYFKLFIGSWFWLLYLPLACLMPWSLQGGPSLQPHCRKTRYRRIAPELAKSKEPQNFRIFLQFYWLPSKELKR